ncbi:MAG: lipase family protein [Deltaproteobacteria bacterium]
MFLAHLSSSIAAILVSLTVTTVPEGRSVYDPPSPLPPGKHGELIWVQHLPTRIPNARAWKVLYRSTDIHGAEVPVSGMVIAPRGKAPATGRPVVTFAHGTTGLARACAPSSVADPAKDAQMFFWPESGDNMDSGVPSLTRMIAAGYVVAATDFSGLGAPGFHQYLIGPTSARNTLDAARAAQQIPDAGAGSRTVILGWSEGGQAAVWAAQIADYAKGPVDVLGAVAVAPVNSAEQIRLEREMAAAGKKLPAMTGAETVMGLYATARTFPELQISDVLTPSGVAFVTEAAKHQCSKHMGQALEYEQAQRGPAMRSDPQNLEAWGKRTVQMALGSPPARVPVAVYQGDDDPTIFPAASEAYVKQACASGTVALYTHYPKTDHLQVPFRAADDYMAWIADRFAGKPAPSSCR